MLNLLEATTRTDNVNSSAFVKLLKKSVTTLNGYTRQGFPFDSWEVIALVLEAVAIQADWFE